MKKVLFICIGNSCRSQMAKGFFNTLSSSESADSAGIKPETYIEPNTISVMNEVGIDISHYEPKKLTFQMKNQFDIFVIMDCSAINVLLLLGKKLLNGQLKIRKEHQLKITGGSRYD